MTIPYQHPLFSKGDRVVMTGGDAHSMLRSTQATDCSGLGTVIRVEPRTVSKDIDGSGNYKQTRCLTVPWHIYVRFDNCSCDCNYPGCNGWPIDGEGVFNRNGKKHRRKFIFEVIESLDPRFASIAKEL